MVGCMWCGFLDRCRLSGWVLGLIAWGWRYEWMGVDEWMDGWRAWVDGFWVGWLMEVRVDRWMGWFLCGLS